MDKGYYEDARERWVEVLIKDPNNKEALVAKKECEEKILNNLIIKVRDLQLMGNVEGSIDKAFEVVDIMKQWGSVTDYNSSVFLRKEIEKQFPYFSKKISSLSQTKPLKAFLELNRIYLMFGGESNVDVVKLKSLVNKEVNSFCKSVVNQSSVEAKRKFNIFCKDVNLSRVIASKTELVVNSNIGNYSKQFESMLVNKLKLGLEQSPLFKSLSFSPELSIKGNVSTNVKEWVSVKQHKYTETEPYVSYVEMLRTKNVPYDDTVYTCNGSYCYNKSVTKYRVEYYTVTEPVTKYKSIPRILNYNVNNKSTSIEYNLIADLKLKHIGVKLPFVKKKENYDYSHSVTIGGTGLSPKEFNVLDFDSIHSQIHDELILTLKDSIEGEWSRNWCRSAVGTSHVDINYVVNCELVNPSNAHVVNWYNLNIGVSPEKLSQVKWDI